MQYKSMLVLAYALLSAPAHAGSGITPGNYDFETFSVPGTAAGPNNLQVNQINDTGLVVGAQFTTPGENGYLRHANGTIVKFSNPLTTGTPDTFAYGLNNFGTAVGTYFDTAHNQFSGYFYHGGHFTTYNLPGLPAGSATVIVGLNDLGDFCGYYQAAPAFATVAFVNRHGSIQTFDFPGSTFIEATQINDEGDVAGTYIDSKNVDHGFIRGANGAITVIDVPGAAFSGTLLIGLNNRGWTSGHFWDSTNHEHGFARSPQGKFYQIDVPEANTNGGGLGTAGGGINDEGVVVGHYDPAAGGPEKAYIAFPERDDDE